MSKMQDWLDYIFCCGCFCDSEDTGPQTPRTAHPRGFHETPCPSAQGGGMNLQETEHMEDPELSDNRADEHIEYPPDPKPLLPDERPSTSATSEVGFSTMIRESRSSETPIIGKSQYAELIRAMGKDSDYTQGIININTNIQTEVAIQMVGDVT